MRFVLAAVGTEEWRAVAERKFPVRLFVAGKGSVCLPANVQGMVALAPRARVVDFPEAAHSIHNSRTQEFAQAVEDVYQEVEQASELGSWDFLRDAGNNELGS